MNETYTPLLEVFKSLPKIQKNRTLMQVSGYPHYENVSSNILAFFFDSEEEHGLGDLLIRSFYEVSNHEVPSSLRPLAVHREYTTNDGKRIDLVIEGEDYTIGIENKIYHWLANDLNHYSETLEKRFTKNILKVVLGLHTPAQKLDGRFISITYTQLWDQVQSNLGHYIPSANQKWLTYLLDFIETTKQLTTPNMELQQNDQFFIDNHEEVNNLIHERSKFHKRLQDKVSRLRSMLGDSEESKLLHKTPWVYRKECLVADFLIDEQHKLAFDLVLSPTGWLLQLLGRDPRSRAFMQQMVDSPSFQNQAPDMSTQGDRYHLNTWPIHEDLENILSDLKSWIKKMVTTTKTLALLPHA